MQSHITGYPAVRWKGKHVVEALRAVTRQVALFSPQSLVLLHRVIDDLRRDPGVSSDVQTIGVFIRTADVEQVLF